MEQYKVNLAYRPYQIQIDSIIIAQLNTLPFPEIRLNGI